MSGVISPGELAVGMYISVFEWCEKVSYTCPVTGKVIDEFKINDSPSIQGVPLNIINISGPIIAVRLAYVPRGSWMAPVMFFDSRNVKFLETSEEFFETYGKLMTKSPRPRRTARKIQRTKIQQLEG